MGTAGPKTQGHFTRVCSMDTVSAVESILVSRRGSRKLPEMEILRVACAFILFCASNGEGNEGDVFVSLGTVQGIFPEVNFTCSGSIQSWVFGAQWLGNSDSFTELQIWRPDSEDGSYTKVGNTAIITEENTTRLYEYRLSSLLAFQAGDVLGYYHPAISSSQLRLYFEERRGERQLGYYYERDSAASQLNISGPGSTRLTILVNVVTDPPGCGCGFMSVERMRLLLNLDIIGSLTYTDRRQQITPDMRFTCDGMITKWIIGADWYMNDLLYPELQVWRNVGSDTYQRINGTLIIIESPTQDSNRTRIYEYDNFSPIPVQAGDILGVFIPLTVSSKLRLLSEDRNNPINYYLETGNTVSESPYDMFDIQNTLVRSTGYHPLVSVEISTSAVIPLLTTSISKGVATEPPLSHTPTLPPQSSGGSGALALYISVGVICAVLTSAIILLVVIVCLCRTRKKKFMNTSDNVAYGMSQNVMDIDNVAYMSSTSGDNNKEAEMYDYVITTGGNDIIST